MALYHFAGLVVEMDPQHPTLLKQASPYLTQERNVRPDITIQPEKGYIDAIRKAAPHFSPDMAEYCRFGTLFYRALLYFDGMMLHASAVVLDGRAYLFSAPSGTGKSTHTSGWIKRFGARSFILNDDKPAIRFQNGVLYAYGTPFSGKSDLSRNAVAPVAGICMLERGEQNWIRRLTAEEALPFLYEQTIRRLTREEGTHMLETLIRVASSTPLWRMSCDVSDEAVDLSYRAMSGVETV